MKIRDRIKELRRVPASSLRPNPKNWRTHPKEQADALRGTLAEIGFAEAVVARELPDGSLELIDGHLRAETVGDAEVPVLVLDVTEDEADKLLVTLDPLAAMATVDADALASLVETVDTDSEALRKMIDDLATDAGIEVEPEIVEDEVPEPPVDPITKPGDLWLLGEHRVLCGDSTKAEDVERLMGGEKADMVFTDPPYGVNVEGKSAKSVNMIEGDLTQTAIPFSFELAITIATASDARLYFCGSQGNIYLYQKLFERHCRQLVRLLIWVKNGFVMKPNGYHSGYEIIFNGYKTGGGGLDKWFGPRTEDAASDVWRINRDSAGTYEHPTQKPVALPSRAIVNSSPKGGLVYEPFGGSGSTLIAAEQLGRKCFAIEIDPHFCDVIVKRWETLTGRKATLAT